MPRFFNAIFWEFIQNLPTIVFFVAAVWFWAHQDRWKAITCILAGAIIGPLVIRFTEPIKTMTNSMEPLSVTLVNIVGAGLLMFLFAGYLGARAKWSNKKTDLVLGGLAGAGLALAQSLAEAEPIGIVDILHAIALAVAGFLVIVSIRMLKDKPLPRALANSILIAVIMTLGIGIVEYSHLVVF